MKIAIIDADLIGRKKHRFPNLACMKISAYYKAQGWETELKTDYENLSSYDKVSISKVFMDTEIPFEQQDKSQKTENGIADFYKDNPILNLPNVEYGGTGFFYDKAPPLPQETEHIRPDYHLYDKWVESLLANGGREKDFTYYRDFSIGFATRGCIRKCSFCVNKNYSKCSLHSSLNEFVDEDRPYICLLDDNIFACKDWRYVFDELNRSGKRFQFKQGCDERLLTDEKCKALFNAKWIGDRIFAFDNIKDRELIIDRLQMIRRHTDREIKFYTFCAFNHDKAGVYDENFWARDISDLFERIKILMEYRCLPYVMRYKDYEISPYRGIYINAASWCNQPSMFKKMSFADFCRVRGMSSGMCKVYGRDFDGYLLGGGRKGASWRYYEEFADRYPQIENRYFNMKWESAAQQ